jgi:hypothetical protein
MKKKLLGTLSALTLSFGILGATGASAAPDIENIDIQSYYAYGDTNIKGVATVHSGYSDGQYVDEIEGKAVLKREYVVKSERTFKNYNRASLNIYATGIEASAATWQFYAYGWVDGTYTMDNKSEWFRAGY